jgi:hypothetical protein
VSTPSKPETKLSKAVHDALLAAGFWSLRIQSGKHKVRRGYLHCAEAGTPDRYVVGLGWMEIKRPGEELSYDQKRWHKRATELGERVVVVESASEAVKVAMWWREEMAHRKAMGWDE